MQIVKTIQQAAVKSLSELYKQEFTEKDFQVNQTKPEFEGD
jgi:ribosomal protein S17E